ncbi:MAG: HDOD domain-containing protein [Gemmatimonadales bacterium]|nr:MAG: HDOD domain-containing protein [Gemmatimonadales bacterium]
MDAREMVAGLSSLGSPPVIYRNLLAVLNRPTSRARDIAAVIGEDPGLAAGLLRLVNSSFYAFARRIDSVEKAVTLVGTAQVRDLALATSVISLFDGIPDEELDMTRFWKHSLACGVGARVLGARRGAANVEAYFLAGLLHDLGRLVLLLEGRGMMREAMEMARGDGLPLHEAERRCFGFDHAQVGQHLMERWRLGPALEEAVAFHHVPILATRSLGETAAVHLADLFANTLAWGHSGAPFPAPLAPEAWVRSGLHPGEVSSLLQRVERQWRDAVDLILEPAASA